MNNSCSFSIFLVPFCPWSPKKAATAPFVITRGFVLREDHVFSTMLWSQVSPGLHGHSRARPASACSSAAAGGIHLQDRLISSLGKSARVFQFVSGFSTSLSMQKEDRGIWVEQVTVESAMEASVPAWT